MTLRVLFILLPLLGLVGCKADLTGEYAGTGDVSVHGVVGGKLVGFDLKKAPLKVSVRKDVVELKGAPFTTCSVPAESARQGYILHFERSTCAVSAGGYTGPLPKGAGLASLEKGQLSLTFNPMVDAPTGDGPRDAMFDVTAAPAR